MQQATQPPAPDTLSTIPAPSFAATTVPAPPETYTTWGDYLTAVAGVVAFPRPSSVARFLAALGAA